MSKSNDAIGELAQIAANTTDEEQRQVAVMQLLHALLTAREEVASLTAQLAAVSRGGR
jgi:hypothetical protein